MKHLVLVLFLLVAGMAGFELYRGWVALNRQNIVQDQEMAKAEVHGFEKKVTEKTANRSSRVKDQK